MFYIFYVRFSIQLSVCMCIVYILFNMQVSVLNCCYPTPTRMARIAAAALACIIFMIRDGGVVIQSKKRKAVTRQ